MTVKVALLGSGTVGTEVARLLIEEADLLAARAGDRIELIGIAVNDLAKDRDPIIDRKLLTDDPHPLIEAADIVIELIGGIDTPRELVLEAIASGKSVVTGNKALLATHGAEIYDAAAANDVDVYYEAAVAGAIPVVYAMRESLAGDKVTTIQGILNGTTNFILDEMTTKGLDYEVALKQAQELGFAEADPTADVDGHDAAAKIAILASLAFHTRVQLDDVATEGIRGITADDIATAKKLGYVVKLVATAKKTDAGIEVRVNPTMVPQSHPLAAIAGSFNAVVVEAEAAGRLMFYGRGAGGAPTASAVVSDLVAAAAKIVSGGHAPREIVYGELGLIPAQESKSRYFLTFQVRDEVGTLNTVTKVFAEHGVSIAAVWQNPGDTEKTADLTITTHEATQQAIESTLQGMAELTGVQSIKRIYRVEES